MSVPFCPVKVTTDVISGKWKALIILFLKPGPKRYSKLRKEISGPTHKVLTEQLRQLERDQIVGRTVFAEVPPRVEYRLNALRTNADSNSHGYGRVGKQARIT